MQILMIDSLVGNDYSIWLCRGLAQTGHEVTLVTVEDRSETSNEPFKVLAVSPSKDKHKSKVIKLIQYIYYLGWLLFYILRHKPDIVHFQFFRRQRVESLCFPFLRLFVQKLVFTAHNILPHEHSKVDGFLRALVYRAASTVIVHTDKIKSDLLETYDLDPDRIFVVPAVKPVAGIHNQSITRSSAREKLNIAASAKVLLFFGYIREYKGLDLLLDAFDIAREKVDDLILIVAGKPHTEELLQRYQRQIVLMEHAQHVFFRPEFIPKEDVDDYFKASDALAMPYTHIDFSGIVQEAFAYKKPVLATNVGNFSDVISNGENGYIAEQNTAEAFARMIECAFADMAKLSQMGQTAYEIDAAYPDWVQIGEMTVQVYSAR